VAADSGREDGGSNSLVLRERDPPVKECEGEWSQWSTCASDCRRTRTFILHGDVAGDDVPHAAGEGHITVTTFSSNTPCMRPANWTQEEPCDDGECTKGLDGVAVDDFPPAPRTREEAERSVPDDTDGWPGTAMWLAISIPSAILIVVVVIVIIIYRWHLCTRAQTADGPAAPPTESSSEIPWPFLEKKPSAVLQLEAPSPQRVGGRLVIPGIKRSPQQAAEGPAASTDAYLERGMVVVGASPCAPSTAEGSAASRVISSGQSSTPSFGKGEAEIADKAAVVC